MSPQTKTKKVLLKRGNERDRDVTKFREVRFRNVIRQIPRLLGHPQRHRAKPRPSTSGVRYAQALVMMGCSESKHMIKSKACVNDALKEKVKLAEQEMGEISFKREKEIQVYEQVMLFEIKEEEWKKEKKRLREQVKGLKKKLEDKDEEILMLLGEKATSISTTGGSHHHKVVSRRRQEDKFLMEYMKEQELHREEAVEKWKQLYLGIKMELDDLIQRTYRGGRVSWRVEDDMMEEIHGKMKDKEETIQILKTRVAALEEEANKRKTEFDILRQSLRILSYADKTTRIAKP